MMSQPDRAFATAVALILLALASPGVAFAGEEALIPWKGSHDESIAAPLAFFGHTLGSRLVDPAGADGYLAHLAGSSDRVAAYTLARTHEGRPVRYAVISSARNISRLDALRRHALKLADPGELDPESAAELVEWLPVFTWFAGAVHGDELSSTEAILAAAWHLASATDPRTREILDNAVVFLMPLQNPDGRARFIQSFRQAAGGSPSADPAGAEHHQPWPSGRYNHELFDLNRDWIWLTQPETRGKVAAFLAWRPQVFVDLHEMSTQATYYFAPPVDPIHGAVPGRVRKWFEIMGEANAAAFDRRGFDYFTRERFDLFYPGYGDSWPSLQGAVGMTFEQANPAGIRITRNDGTVLTLRDAIAHHVTALMTTLETSAARRREILEDFYLTRRAGLEKKPGGHLAYLVPPRPDPGGALRLATTLESQGIRVRMALDGFRLRAGPPGGELKSRHLPGGTLVIPAAQAGAPLLAALFDRDPEIDAGVLETAEEMRRFRARPPFFDVTAWDLKAATGLPVLVTPDSPPAGISLRFREPVDELPGHGQPPVGFTPWPPPPPTLPLGEAAQQQVLQETPEPAYGWALRPEGLDGAAALIDLLRDGRWRVEVAGRPFTSGEVSFPAGTALLKRHGNGEGIQEVLSEIASVRRVAFEGLSRGLTEKGPDLGSSTVARLRLPRVAVVYGPPARPAAAGSAAYVLTDLLGLPAVRTRLQTLLKPGHLKRFDVILLPDGKAADYREELGEKGLERLGGWVESGGTLITLGESSALAAHPEVAWSGSTLLPSREPSKPAGDGTKPGKDDAAGAERVPGAFLRVRMEEGHPLAFGLGKEIQVLVRSALAFSPTDKGINAALFSPVEELKIGGFAWPESLKRLAGSAYAVVEKLGDGQVILFTGDPTFRGAQPGLSRMVANAVLFVPSYKSWPRHR